MNLRHCALPALAAAAVALPLEGSMASTCKDELDRFESRLYDSAVAESDPQLFQELVREAERAAELRDEARCLQRVAELNEALPERAVPPTSRAVPEQETSDEPARPKAPLLLVTSEDESAEVPEDEEDDPADQGD